MKSIFAVEAVPSTHPAWCAADIPSHISAEKTVIATSGPERTKIYVSIEQETDVGATPAIRLQGAGDTPMTPQQAVRLGMLLVEHATLALSTPGLPR